MQVHLVGDQEVENMVGALTGRLVGDTRLFKQVNFNIASCHFTHVVKPNPNKLSKAGGIIVSDCLGISKGFHDRIGLNNLIFKGCLFLVTFLDLFNYVRANKSKVSNDFLGILSFACSRFTGNQNGLIFAF